ncbi:MAG: O-antigen ligase family protein [Pirellulales bacterium]
MSKQRNSLPPIESPPSDRWQTALLAAFISLVVARTFVPEDPGGKMGHGAPLDVLWIVLAAAWLLGEFRRGRLRLRFAWPDGLLLALVGWCAASAIMAMQSGSPRPAVNVLWDWVAMGLVFLLARQILETERDVRALVVIMIGLSCGMSAVAVHQYFVTIPADVAAYDAAKGSVEALYDATGQWLEPGSSERMRFEARLDSRLPAATFALSNSLAGFLVPWLVMLIGIVFDLRRRTLIIVSLAVATLMVVCIWFTGSRSASVAVIAGLLLLAVDRASNMTSSRRSWTVAIAGLVVIAVVAAAILAGTPIGERAANAAWRSMAFRVEYWRATLAMIADHPFFGCGLGQFQDTYTAYKLVGAAEEIQDPHNWLLEIWATAGAPAAILLVALIGAVAVRTLRTHRAKPAMSTTDSSSAPDAAVVGAIGGVVLGTALAWLTGYPIARLHLLFFVAAIVGVWFLLGGWRRDGRRSLRLPLIAAIALLVNLLAAGGIGFPTVADSLWLLLAMQLNVLGAPADGTRSVAATTSVRWLAGLALAAVLATAIRLEYIPVMGSRLHLATADAARAAGQAGPYREALEAALAADPWSTTAATQLTAQRFADYQALPTATQIRALAEADARARQLAPRRSGVWAQSADFAAAIFRETQDVEYREAAEGYYARALALYPTNADLQAEVAKFWQSLGEAQRAREAATEALRLDDATRAAGHRDRILGDALRQELESLAETPR